MQKILVTGATGFIGNYVIEQLLQRNFSVIATSSNIASPRFTIIKGEYLDNISCLVFSNSV